MKQDRKHDRIGRGGRALDARDSAGTVLTSPHGSRMPGVAVCIGCGCDDMHACAEGCWWLRVDRKVQLGVCSSCEVDVPRWDAGDRALSEDAKVECD